MAGALAITLDPEDEDYTMGQSDGDLEGACVPGGFKIHAKFAF